VKPLEIENFTNFNHDFFKLQETWKRFRHNKLFGEDEFTTNYWFKLEMPDSSEKIAINISFKSSDYEFIFPKYYDDLNGIKVAGLAVADDFEAEIEDNHPKLTSKILFYKDYTKG
jgi:hypothetical protein